jgi:hypothetical protein
VYRRRHEKSDWIFTDGQVFDLQAVKGVPSDPVPATKTKPGLDRSAGSARYWRPGVAATGTSASRILASIYL